MQVYECALNYEKDIGFLMKNKRTKRLIIGKWRVATRKVIAAHHIPGAGSAKRLVNQPCSLHLSLCAIARDSLHSK